MPGDPAFCDLCDVILIFNEKRRIEVFHMKIIMRQVFMILYFKNHEYDSAKGGVFLIKIKILIKKPYQTMDTFPLLMTLATTSMTAALKVRMVAIAAAVPKLLRATSL